MEPDGRGWTGVKGAAEQVAVPMQAQEPIRFQHGNLISVHEAAARCPELQLVTDGEVLPLGVDFPGTRAAGVVEAVPGIPAAPV
jgi:hypothetical protein